MSTQAFTLLNPGPINVSKAVRRALAESPDQCHREVEYLEMQGRVRSKLVEAFGIAADYEAALLTGSGTAGMEAMVASVCGDGVVVIDNGVYGDRLAKMATANGVTHRRVTYSWFERPDLEAIESALSDEFDTIAVVHHETTTGLLNDLAPIGELARKHGKRLIIDSISGLAGETFDFDAIRPDAVCCTANKCVQGLPGVSFVFVRNGTELRQRSVYLDLGNLLTKQRAGDTPFTPAIQVTAALETALDELIEETVEGRIARYGRASAAIRTALANLQLDLLLPEAYRSNTITCARLPEGVTYEQMHARMREEGYVIYAGQGSLSREAFRVANMGLIPDEALERFEPALRKAIS